MKLPLVDEHTASVRSDPEEVWWALLTTLESTFSGKAARAYARAVGCREHMPGGPRPLEPGSTIAGFAVLAAAPGCDLVLGGRHLFATYQLRFHIEGAAGEGIALRAQTRAAFHGLPGATYKAIVVRSGGHAWAMTRLVHRVAKEARQGFLTRRASPSTRAGSRSVGSR